jgi:hypothetical protein
MRIAALTLSGLGLLATGTAASAASPAYCALYAREFAASKISAPIAGDAAGAVQRVQDQAYYRCLNQDEDPAFPETSAYFGAEIDQIYGDTIEQGDAAGAIPDQPVTAADAVATTGTAGGDPGAAAAPAAQAKPIRTATAASGRKKGGSGLEQWSDEWVSWCKDHYRSFNETTGMVLTLSHERKMCP